MKDVPFLLDSVKYLFVCHTIGATDLLTLLQDVLWFWRVWPANHPATTSVAFPLHPKKVGHPWYRVYSPTRTLSQNLQAPS